MQRQLAGPAYRQSRHVDARRRAFHYYRHMLDTPTFPALSVFQRHGLMKRDMPSPPTTLSIDASGLAQPHDAVFLVNTHYFAHFHGRSQRVDKFRLLVARITLSVFIDHTRVISSSI